MARFSDKGGHIRWDRGWHHPQFLSNDDPARKAWDSVGRRMRPGTTRRDWRAWLWGTTEWLLVNATIEELFSNWGAKDGDSIKLIRATLNQRRNLRLVALLPILQQAGSAEPDTLMAGPGAVMRTLICKNCSAQLFIIDSRRPVCGNCRQPITELMHYRRWKSFRRVAYAIVLFGCVCVRALRAVTNGSRRAFSSAQQCLKECAVSNAWSSLAASTRRTESCWLWSHSGEYVGRSRSDNHGEAAFALAYAETQFNGAMAPPLPSANEPRIKSLTGGLEPWKAANLVGRFVTLIQDTSAGTNPDWVDLGHGRMERAEWVTSALLHQMLPAEALCGPTRILINPGPNARKLFFADGHHSLHL